MRFGRTMEYRASHERLIPHGADGGRRVQEEIDLTIGLVGRIGARRVFGSCAWLVYELRPADGARGRLVFECPEMMRVVRGYPANWRDLSDGELLALSEHT